MKESIAAHARVLTHSLIIGVMGICCLMCSGCHVKDHDDPFEPFNRTVHRFNRSVDQSIIQPIAKTYTQITPRPIRHGVTNLFDNLLEAPTAINDVLQGRVFAGASSLWRFIINSTFGIAGLFDVASHVGLKKHFNTFGNTLAQWGIHKPPYLVVPFIGPSNLRDALGFGIDNTVFSVQQFINPLGVRYGLSALRGIDRRANLLEHGKVVNEVELDAYSFEKNTYEQLRKAQLKDKIPTEQSEVQQDLDWALDEDE